MVLLAIGQFPPQFLLHNSLLPLELVSGLASLFVMIHPIAPLLVLFVGFVIESFLVADMRSSIPHARGLDIDYSSIA